MSLAFVRDCTGSLHRRHFLTRGEHKEHVATWPQGPNSVSRFVSEHTMQSSNDSCSALAMLPGTPLATLLTTRAQHIGFRHYAYSLFNKFSKHHYRANFMIVTCAVIACPHRLTLFDRILTVPRLLS